MEKLYCHLRAISPPDISFDDSYAQKVLARMIPARRYHRGYGEGSRTEYSRILTNSWILSRRLSHSSGAIYEARSGRFILVNAEII